MPKKVKKVRPKEIEAGMRILAWLEAGDADPHVNRQMQELSARLLGKSDEELLESEPDALDQLDSMLKAELTGALRSKVAELFDPPWTFFEQPPQKWGDLASNPEKKFSAALDKALSQIRELMVAIHNPIAPQGRKPDDSELTKQIIALCQEDAADGIKPRYSKIAEKVDLFDEDGKPNHRRIKKIYRGVVVRRLERRLSALRAARVDSTK